MTIAQLEIVLLDWSTNQYSKARGEYLAVWMQMDIPFTALRMLSSSNKSASTSSSRSKRRKADEIVPNHEQSQRVWLVAEA